MEGEKVCKVFYYDFLGAYFSHSDLPVRHTVFTVDYGSLSLSHQAPHRSPMSVRARIRILLQQDAGSRFQPVLSHLKVT